MKKNNRKGSVSSMFMHTDGVDFLLMLFGFIGSVGDGLISLLVLFINSCLMNNVGTGSSAVSLSDSFLNSINEVQTLSLSLIHTRGYMHAHNKETKSNWVWFLWVTKCIVLGSKTLCLNVLELQFVMLANHDQNVQSCFRLAQSMCLLYSWNQVYYRICCVNLPGSIDRELDSID